MRTIDRGMRFVQWQMIMLCFLAVCGSLRAEMLAAWQKANSSTAPTNYLAQTNHSKLASPAIMKWKPLYYTYNDNDYFYIEPHSTNVMVNGVAPSTNTLRQNPPSGNSIGTNSPPFISFTFAVPNGYKLSITNMIWHMQNDEKRLFMVMRSSVDGFKTNSFVKTAWPEPGQTDLTKQFSTNIARVYTNSMNVLDVTDPTVELRLYGTEAKSQWVYMYAFNLGQKIGATAPACDPAYTNYMILFEGEVTPVASPSRGPMTGGNMVTLSNMPVMIGNGTDITNVLVGVNNTTTILGQGTNWVQWVMPPGDSPGSKGITVYSASLGESVFSGAYTYEKLSQTIAFDPIPAQVTTGKVGLAATASSGLPVNFAVASGPAALADGTNLSFTGTGTVSIVASQEGDSNYSAAADVTNTFNVTKAVADVTLGALNQTYDGNARTVTVTTVPAGLAVVVTYDGAAELPTNAGSYAVTGVVNDANYEGTTNGTLVVGKAAATVTLGALNQTYDGNARTATVTTVPAGLAVAVTYDGAAELPTNAGSYAVTGVVNDANYEGTTNGTLVVGKGTATVTLGNLSQTYDGNARTATVTTVPAGLAVVVTYDGAAALPTNAGSYAVTGVVNDANFEGTTNGTLVVGKDNATVTLGNLSQTYDGNARTATVTTVPAGLAVVVTYDGAAALPTNAGSYAVTGVVNDANYQGTTNGTLVVGKGTATVTLGALNQTYDGNARTATVTTVPAGLAVVVTYDGAAALPTNVGSYVVTGVVNDANFEGTTNGTLVVGQADQTLTFPAIGNRITTDTVGLSATASSGLGVSFTVLSGLASISGGTNLTFGGEGSVSIVASQAGDANWNAAPEVTNTFIVTKASQTGLTFTPASPQAYNTTNTLTATGGSGTGAVSFAVESGVGQIVGSDGLWITSGTGGVTVVATKASDEIYQSITATATVTAAKAGQLITFNALADQEATNQLILTATSGSGLPVSFAVLSGPGLLSGGSNLTFSTSGTVSVVASQAGNDDWAVAPEMTNTFAVTKVPAGVTLGNLSQTYDGNARVVTATTVPAGLAVTVTYDGSAVAPTNVGSYAVTGTVSDVFYAASETGTLVVVQGDQTLVFGQIPDQRTNDVLQLSATAGSGLPVSFALLSGPAILSGGSNLSFTGTGWVSLVASQAGDANWMAAPDVTNTFRVGWGLLLTDYDGDGISDLAVYDLVHGDWYIRSGSGATLAWQWNWGYEGALPVGGDYNGDGCADPAVYEESTGFWSIRELATGNVLAFKLQWGFKGTDPIPGDYDGDGKTDLAVYDRGQGRWYIRSLAGAVLATNLSWGYAGTEATTADFDGDGRSDLVVYDLKTGNWFVCALTGEILVWNQNWGFAGARPLSGDYNGDGLADLVVQDEVKGSWFVRSLSGSVLAWNTHWGFKGGLAGSGDYNGDGCSDLSVYGFDAVAPQLNYVGQWFVLDLDLMIPYWHFQWGASELWPVGVKP